MKGYFIDKGFVNDYSGAHISNQALNIEFDTFDQALKVVRELVSKESDSNYYYEINRFEDGEYEDTSLTIHSFDALKILEKTDRIDVLGTLIKERRQLLYLTQTQLAEKMEVDIRTIQKWEAGDRTPDAKNILKLIKLLELNQEEVEELL